MSKFDDFLIFFSERLGEIFSQPEDKRVFEVTDWTGKKHLVKGFPQLGFLSESCSCDLLEHPGYRIHLCRPFSIRQIENAKAK